MGPLAAPRDRKRGTCGISDGPKLSGMFGIEKPIRITSIANRIGALSEFHLRLVHRKCIPGAWRGTSHAEEPPIRAEFTNRLLQVGFYELAKLFPFGPTVRSFRILYYG